MQQRIEKLLTKKIKTKTKTINKYKIKKMNSWKILCIYYFLYEILFHLFHEIFGT